MLWLDRLCCLRLNARNDALLELNDINQLVFVHLLLDVLIELSVLIEPSVSLLDLAPLLHKIQHIGLCGLLGLYLFLQLFVVRLVFEELGDLLFKVYVGCARVGRLVELPVRVILIEASCGNLFVGNELFRVSFQELINLTQKRVAVHQRPRQVKGAIEDQNLAFFANWLHLCLTLDVLII